MPVSVALIPKSAPFFFLHKGRNYSESFMRFVAIHLSPAGKLVLQQKRRSVCRVIYASFREGQRTTSDIYMCLQLERINLHI